MLRLPVHFKHLVEEKKTTRFEDSRRRPARVEGSYRQLDTGKKDTVPSGSKTPGVEPDTVPVRAGVFEPERYRTPY